MLVLFLSLYSALSVEVDDWRKAPRVHVYDSAGCFDFNFIAYNHHIFGFVSKKGIKIADTSSYDFYFVEADIHIFGYEQSLDGGDKISSMNTADALADENKPSIQEILAEKFNLAVDFNFKSGKCFDYNFVQGGVNCFGMYEVGGIFYNFSIILIQTKLLMMAQKNTIMIFVMKMIPKNITLVSFVLMLNQVSPLSPHR